MTNNINTLSAMLAEAKRIAAANAAEPKPEYVVAMHDLHENAKQALSREEYATLWDAIKPAVSGVKDFAGKGWKKNHPDAASPMPKYVTDAQAERKAAKADKPAQPKAAKAPAKTSKPAAPKTPAKDKQPSQREMLANLLVAVNGLDRKLDGIDKRLAAVEKKLAK